MVGIFGVITLAVGRPIFESGSNTNVHCRAVNAFNFSRNSQHGNCLTDPRISSTGARMVEETKWWVVDSAAEIHNFNPLDHRCRALTLVIFGYIDIF